MEQTRRKIIVVGGDTDSRRFLVDKLDQQGYLTVGFRDPLRTKEYLTRASTKAEYLVIIDMEPLAKMSQDSASITLVRFLECERIAVVMMTELAPTVVCEYVGDPQYISVVTKPFVPNTLMKLVYQLCQQEVPVEIKVR